MEPFTIAAIIAGAIFGAAVVITVAAIIETCKELFNRYRNSRRIDFVPRDTLLKVVKKDRRLRNLKKALEENSAITGAHLVDDGDDEWEYFQTTTTELDSDVSSNGYTKYRNDESLYHRVS